MNEFEEKIRKIGRCAKPVLFETDIDEVPYAGAGTTFFVKVGLNLFLISTRHVFGDYPFEKFLVFPNTETDDSVPFTEAFSIANRDPHDPDFSDIVLARVDLKTLHLSDNSNMTVLDLEKASDDWRDDPYNQKYIVFGYPNEKGEIDYEECNIFNCQQLVVCEFDGASPSRHCYKLKILGSNNFSNCDGLSGSPVLAFPLKPNKSSRLSFCGMVLRGTTTSSPLHFIDSKIIRHVIQLAINT